MKTRHLLGLCGSLVCTQALLGLASAYGGSATWSPTPQDGSWNQFAPNNWLPNTVPNAVDDIATFASSNVTSIGVVDIEVGAVVFEPGASAYTFTMSGANTGLGVFGAGITNDSGVAQNFVISPPFGSILFTGSSTAGDDTVFTANPGRFAGESGARVFFLGSSNAGTGTFVAEGEQVINGFAGNISFEDTSSAAGATVTAQGSAVNIGATIMFEDRSTAGHATLIGESGSGSGDGGTIILASKRAGGSMRIVLFGDGSDSPQNGLLSVISSAVIGSIEGGGRISLGTSVTVTVGTNDLSTTFDGVILGTSDNSLIKTGTGTLTLTNGANTYSGGTNVNKGALIINNTTGFGAGGSIQANAGSLGGNGTVLGPVTVGNGKGRAAVLAPAQGSTLQTTFTVESALTFKSNATYKCGLKARANEIRADNVIAGGVTIESGAIFSLRAIIEGTPAPGATVTAISNTSAAPIQGSFENLPDGGLILAGGATFQADYEGGDGNDLTLTVVPRHDRASLTPSGVPVGKIGLSGRALGMPVIAGRSLGVEQVADASQLRGNGIR